jgi:tRNA pseudouridine55 synthase
MTSPPDFFSTAFHRAYEYSISRFRPRCQAEALQGDLPESRISPEKTINCAVSAPLFSAKNTISENLLSRNYLEKFLLAYTAYSVDGFVNIAKPAGMTSFDVVARCKRLLSEKRVGHAGTLDPDATGVLVIAVGQATRLLPFLNTEPKIYRAVCGFGRATDTEDASGQTTQEADATGLTEAALRAALPSFLGEIQQVPPMVSALHHEGQRLYDLARQGITVERPARTITIHALELLAFTAGPEAQATLRVTCGGGTYIRTLCKDLGEALGLPAHMAALEREGVGPFELKDALTLETLTAERLVPLHIALGWPTIEADDAMATDLKLGRAIIGEAAREAAVLHRGRLLALVRPEGGRLQPFKVFGP